MKTLDYRRSENRHAYFTQLYELNLDQKILAGLVYLYFPNLKHHFGWDQETALWFAFLNGMTQNPLTSLRIFSRWPQPLAPKELPVFQEWFDAEWPRLQYDTDRKYAKVGTPQAIKSYIELISEHGSQTQMLTGKTFAELWKLVNSRYYTFGRLSAFSYLEFVYIMGAGAECDNLFLTDKEGSRSHRNALLLLTGRDHLVWDKRMKNGFDGKYEDFPKLCAELAEDANEYLMEHAPRLPHAGLFTLETNLCTWKNTHFGYRYPGVYSDLAYDRLKWYEQHIGPDQHTQLLWGIREQLEGWLRNEVRNDGLTLRQRAAIFPTTGYPYRGEYFL